MYNTDIKKILEKHYSLFENLDYKVESFIEEREVILSLSKHTDNFFYRVTLPFIGINGFDVGVKIGYKQIEYVINPIMKKVKIWGNIDLVNVTTSSLYTLEKELYEQTKISSESLKSEKDIVNLLNELKNYTKNVAEPFFEKWSDLQVLNDFFDKIPQKEVGKYFGQSGIFKKAIVYKLCNNPKFEEYFDWLYIGLVKGWEQDPTQDIIWKQFADAIIELEKVLKTIEPKYNVC